MVQMKCKDLLLENFLSLAEELVFLLYPDLQLI
jgi:hypothetical protein